MILMTLLSLTFLTVTMLLMILSMLISKKSKKMQEKLSPFECGFNYFNLARMPFSMQFFLISIIFIIFDVEIILVVPLIPSMFKSNILKWTYTTILFFTILILGVLLEWKEKTFNWKK